MSQATKDRPTGREFLGLHDPYAAPTGPAGPRQPQGPLVDREKASELLRAGFTLCGLFVAIAAVIAVLG